MSPFNCKNVILFNILNALPDIYDVIVYTNMFWIHPDFWHFYQYLLYHWCDNKQ